MADVALSPRAQLLGDLRDIARQRGEPGWRTRPLTERQALVRSDDELHGIYFRALPMITISRCPTDGNLVQKRMDVVGLDGPWWKLGAHDDPPTGDPHLVTYTGALDLQGVVLPAGLPSDGGEIQPGPDVPYVIPRLLAIDGVRCVISSTTILPQAARVYFMTYFAEPRLPAAQSHQQWLRDVFYYIDPAGFRRWNGVDDVWDFELAPWIRRGKVHWIAPGDASWTPVSGRPKQCPYLGLEGARTPRRIRDGRIEALPLPAGAPRDYFE